MTAKITKKLSHEANILVVLAVLAVLSLLWL
jgi:hypothetical protein